MEILPSILEWTLDRPTSPFIGRRTSDATPLLDPRAVVAFDVSSLQDAMTILGKLGARQAQPPHDEGFGLVTSYLDPNGNQFELVELRYEFAKSGS